MILERLEHGGTVVEGEVGNTGIGLTHVSMDRSTGRSGVERCRYSRLVYLARYICTCGWRGAEGNEWGIGLQKVVSRIPTFNFTRNETETNVRKTEFHLWAIAAILASGRV